MSGSGEDFGRAVAEIGVAQLCEGVGFHAFQRSAAEALADIALRYLSDLAKAAHFYANLAGRTECNALDVIMAMEDVGTGPSSATDTTRTLANSKALQDVMRYVEYSEEIPFSRPLPHFPITKKRVAPPSFAQLGETPPHAHIPAWLPAFPDPHTYKSTPVWDERKSDPRIDKLEIARQRRKAERSLVSLHLRLSSGRAAIKGAEPLGQNEAPPRTAAGASSSQAAGAFPPPSSPSHPSRQQWPPASEQAVLLSKLESEGQQGKGKGKRVTAAWQNPYLEAPFAAGEREASVLTFHGKKVGENGLQIRELEPKPALPSVLETFPAALEIGKRGMKKDADTVLGSSGQSLPEAKDRRPVLMSFDWGRKARRRALTAQISMGSLQCPSTAADKGNAVVAGKEEEKDDRKRRAEQILAQSYMEGADDASQP